MSKTDIKLALVNSHNELAVGSASALRKLYDFVDINKADVIVALGGDGYMLHLFHELIEVNKPIFGMNLGTVGFLLNQYDTDNLLGVYPKPFLSNCILLGWKPSILMVTKRMQSHLMKFHY